MALKLTISQEELDGMDLVVLVDKNGILQWASKRSRRAVADMLHQIAAGIASGRS